MGYANLGIKEKILLQIMNDSLIDNVLSALFHVFPLDTMPAGVDVYINWSEA